MFDLAAQRFLPKVWLVVSADAFREGEPFVGKQRKTGDTQHHALIRFRGMAGNGQVAVIIIVAIHIGDIDLGFEDCGF